MIRFIRGMRAQATRPFYPPVCMCTYVSVCACVAGCLPPSGYFFLIKKIPESHLGLSVILSVLRPLSWPAINRFSSVLEIWFVQNNTSTILNGLSADQTFFKSKQGCKDQESTQSSTTPDPGYQWESDKLTVRHHKREPRGQPFSSR